MNCLGAGGKIKPVLTLIASPDKNVPVLGCKFYGNFDKFEFPEFFNNKRWLTRTIQDRYSSRGEEPESITVNQEERYDLQVVLRYLGN